MVLKSRGADLVPGVARSVIKLGQMIPLAAKDPSALGMHWIQVVFFVFTLAMPLTFIASGALLWTLPLCYTQQRQMFIITEVFYAWYQNCTYLRPSGPRHPLAVITDVMCRWVGRRWRYSSSPWSRR